MKKVIFSLLAIFAATTLSAQSKGELYIGGQIGVGTNSVIIEGTSGNSTTFTIAPEVGYFVTDKIKIGGTFGYSLESSDGSISHTITIMPNFAYYVRLCDKFYYTPGFEIGFACGVAKDITMPGFGVGLSLGSFEFRPMQKLAFSVNLLSLNYTFLTYKEKPYIDLKTNNVNFNLGINPSVGLKYYF